MSIKAETRKRIQLYMLEHIDNDDEKFASKTISNFQISKTTVYNYIKKLLADELIKESDISKCGYELVCKSSRFLFSTESSLSEDRIFKQNIQPLLNDLPQNVYEIIRHIFLEMMNNAIEHSQAKNIAALVKRNCLNTKIYIMDNGIGIFKNIQQFFAAKGEDITLDEAVEVLFPGKFTTAKSTHSGEGIFFSSRAADFFAIYSDDKFFAHDNFSESLINVDKKDLTPGTCVAFLVSNNSSKQLSDIFSMYTDIDKGFIKTSIPIAHMFSDGYPASRSEARRLASSISDFDEVTLDFSNVPSVGQAFVHELFIVFKSTCPSISIHTMNANEEVERMIRRVTSANA